MDILEKIIRENSWKFDKGYPDSQEDINYLKSIIENQLKEQEDEEEKLVEVEFVDFSFTGVFLNYAINKIVRGKNSVIMAPDGKRPFQLRGSYKSTNSFSGEWESKYDDAIRRIKAKKQTKVKKSWGYSLWG